MSKRFKVLSVKTHVWDVINNVNNVVLLKCTCCKQPRIGVAEQREKERYMNGTKVTSTEYTFWYHGYDAKYAEKLFNELVQKRSKNNDEDYYDDDNNVISNNNKRNSNRTLVLNNAKVTITNAYFHVRGEDDEYQR
jgi:hypothetical protein